tara:strand:+ start:2660 stop:3244 length:585 start_codon:yes stop_codon:yes gene_type:complete
MTNIFTLDKNDGFSDKLNIDELYETKHKDDLNKLTFFNKMLNRIHSKIKMVSKQKTNDQLCWFLVPEIIIGVPKYDQGGCIAYLIDKLKTNGFNVKYIHPNLLLISWSHFVPSYVRDEIKQKTGIVVNEYGKQIDGNERVVINAIDDKKDESTYNTNLNEKNKVSKKEYTPIKSYKPLGNLIYTDNLLNKNNQS